MTIIRKQETNIRSKVALAHSNLIFWVIFVVTLIVVNALDENGRKRKTNSCLAVNEATTQKRRKNIVKRKVDMKNSINGIVDKRFEFVVFVFFPGLFSEFEIHGIAYNVLSCLQRVSKNRTVFGFWIIM